MLIFQRWLDVQWMLSKCGRLFVWENATLASQSRLLFRTIHAVNRHTNDPIKVIRRTSLQSSGQEPLMDNNVDDHARLSMVGREKRRSINHASIEEPFFPVLMDFILFKRKCRPSWCFMD
jgi:hypothetical protein